MDSSNTGEAGSYGESTWQRLVIAIKGINRLKILKAAKSFVGVVIILTVYFGCGIGLTLFNKWFLSAEGDGFHFPITLIMAQSIANFFLTSILVFTCLKSTLSTSDYWMTKITWREYMIKFAPLGTLFAADIVMSSYGLVYSSVAFVEIIKSGVPILILFAGFINGKDPLSFLKIVIIFSISVGISLTSLSETNFSYLGFIFAVGGVLAGAGKLILLENALRAQGRAKINPLLLYWYFTPAAGLALAIPFMFVDEQRLAASQFFDRMHFEKTIGIIGIGVFMAFGLNISEFLIIKHTSALTLCVCGVTKLIIVIFISIPLFNHHVTTVNAIGIVITIVGVIFYNLHRYKKGEGKFDNDVEQEHQIEDSVHLSNTSIINTQKRHSLKNGEVEFMPLQSIDGLGDSDSDTFEIPSDIEDGEDVPLQHNSADVAYVETAQ